VDVEVVIVRRIAPGDLHRDDLAGIVRRRAGDGEREGVAADAVTAVAGAMSKPRTQVQRWLRRLGIDPASFRG